MRAREDEGTLRGKELDGSMCARTARSAKRAVGAEERGREDAGVATGPSTQATEVGGADTEEEIGAVRIFTDWATGKTVDGAIRRGDAGLERAARQEHLVARIGRKGGRAGAQAGAED